MRHVAIDIETNGLSFRDEHEMVRFCAVEILEAGRLGSFYQSLVKPAHPINPLASELTGINDQQLEASPTFSEIASLVAHFIQDAILVSSHADFERAFLNKALTSVGRRALGPNRFFDLRRKVPREFRNRGLAGIYDYLGINPTKTERPSEEVAHLYWRLSILPN